MKKSFFSLALGAAMVLSATSAMAATACSGSAGDGTAVTGAATSFVRVTFTPKCSANTLVDYTDQGTNFAVAAGSTKGKTTFIGNTVGGGIVASTSTCASGCTATELGAALTAAAALSTASSPSSSSSGSSSTTP